MCHFFTSGTHATPLYLLCPKALPSLIFFPPLSLSSLPLQVQVLKPFCHSLGGLPSFLLFLPTSFLSVLDFSKPFEFPLMAAAGEVVPRASFTFGRGRESDPNPYICTSNSAKPLVEVRDYHKGKKAMMDLTGVGRSKSI